jgi:hypothetical protein
VALVEALCLVWAALALRIDAGAPLWLDLACVGLSGALLLWLRPRWLGQALFLLAFAGLLAWWFRIEPRNDRLWLGDVARLSRLEIEGDQLTVHDLRNFDYRSDTDFTPRWEERRYDLARLTGVDIYLSDWGAAGIVHTLLCWEFEDAEPLAISIETRKEEGESYSALRGFFRQYELYYVVADERDLIRVRADVRGEQLRLYRLNVPIPVARALLLGYAERVNRLAREPAWYNALSANCTTTIRLHVQELGLERPLNWRLLANKHVDELLYMRGALDTTLPFEELRRRSDITDAARAAGDDPAFSQLIRQGLPARRPEGR